MDDLTAIREFRTERDNEPPEAREAIRRALDARMNAAAAEARAFGEAVAGSRPPVDSRRRRRGFLSRRHRLLAFGAGIVAAAIVAGALVLSSGPTAQRASAAEILHEAAAAASASGAAATAVPGPDQFFFRAEQRLDVRGWVSPVPPFGTDIPTESTGGPMKYANAYNAVVSTRVDSWIGDGGGGRYREVLGDLDFWSKTEEGRWKKAGSPLPPPFNPEYRRLYPVPFRDALEANRHVVDTTHKGFGHTFHYPDTSKLPTAPKALRRAVEANAIEVSGFNLMYPKAKHLDTEQTKEELINILFEGAASSPLQAAIFEALAELPGINLVAAADSLGRHGDAIKFAPEEGIRREYLFDPETSQLLANRGVLVDPAASRTYQELPAGTTVAERDFIAAGVVDSIRQREGGAEATGS
ncbi:MAG TPA: hypothetical protein VGH14_07585 [Solirubrobacterales bacterium]|jgi:hypothetical protein